MGRRRGPDPATLTPAQRRVIRLDDVTHVGWDEKWRPVVRAMTGIPQQERTWALLKNGDPTDVTGAVTDDENADGFCRPFHTHPYLTERGDRGHAHPWGDRPHMHHPSPAR